MAVFAFAVETVFGSYRIQLFRIDLKIDYIVFQRQTPPDAKYDRFPHVIDHDTIDGLTDGIDQVGIQ